MFDILVYVCPFSRNVLGLVAELYSTEPELSKTLYSSMGRPPSFGKPLAFAPEIGVHVMVIVVKVDVIVKDGPIIGGLCT